MAAIRTAYPIQTPTHHLYKCSFLFLVELVLTHTGKDTKKVFFRQTQWKCRWMVAAALHFWQLELELHLKGLQDNIISIQQRCDLQATELRALTYHSVPRKSILTLTDANWQLDKDLVILFARSFTLYSWIPPQYMPILNTNGWVVEKVCCYMASTKYKCCFLMYYVGSQYFLVFPCQSARSFNEES